MSPKQQCLGVRPQVPVLVGLGALVLLAVTASARSGSPSDAAFLLRERTPKFVRTDTLQPVARDESPQPTRSDAGAASGSRPSTSSPVETDPVPSVPPVADEDAPMLQAWILSLSDAELRSFDASGALNRRLAQIVADESRRNSDSSAVELDRFLLSLNARLGAVAP